MNRPKGQNRILREALPKSDEQSMPLSRIATLNSKENAGSKVRVIN
jgi:hypothetical protein